MSRVIQLCRASLFVAFLALITPPFSLVALLGCWLPATWRYHTIGQWNRCVILAARFLCGIHHHVEGMANLPRPPYVICSKHQSAWETLAYYQLFPRNCFVVKRSLLLIPFFGWGMYLAMGPIPINRGNPMSAMRNVMRTGKRRLAAGWNVVIFPEGTRIAVGQTHTFLPSACVLAIQAGVPVVPVALNSGRCWPRNRWGFFKVPGKIIVSIGKPLATAGSKSRDLTAQVEHWINSETKRLDG